jgi:uncharacterized membrane protein
LSCQFPWLSSLLQWYYLSLLLCCSNSYSFWGCWDHSFLGIYRLYASWRWYLWLLGLKFFFFVSIWHGSCYFSNVIIVYVL